MKIITLLKIKSNYYHEQIIYFFSDSETDVKDIYVVKQFSHKASENHHTHFFISSFLTCSSIVAE